MDKLLQIISEIDIPSAYDHFAEGESPDPPFICYLLPGVNNFSAAGKAYFKADQVHLELYTDITDNFAADGWAYFKVDKVYIELYTDEKSPETESRVEAVLDEHGIFYDRTEVWIESEKLYEVLYYFEMEAD